MCAITVITRSYSARRRAPAARTLPGLVFTSRHVQCITCHGEGPQERPAFAKPPLPLNLAALPHGLLVLARTGPDEMRDLALAVLDELDRGLAHAGQEFRIRAGHEQSIERMRLVLN